MAGSPRLCQSLKGKAQQTNRHFRVSRIRAREVYVQAKIEQTQKQNGHIVYINFLHFTFAYSFKIDCLYGIDHATIKLFKVVCWGALGCSANQIVNHPGKVWLLYDALIEAPLKIRKVIKHRPFHFKHFSQNRFFQLDG